jgi:hypothetical protein
MENRIFFNSAQVEKSLDSEYDDLFMKKLKEKIKTIKSQTSKCTLKCLESLSINQDCIDQCDLNHQNFFKVIETTFKTRLENFETCKESCSLKKDFQSCHLSCINSLSDWFKSQSLFENIEKSLSN